MIDRLNRALSGRYLVERELCCATWIRSPRISTALDPIAGDERFRALLLRERPPPPRGCGNEQSLRARSARY